MRRIRVAVVVISILTLTLAGSALAQQGMGRKGGQGRLYNPQTVETITGQVVSVNNINRKRYQSVHLTVKTNQGDLTVSLGPKQYLDTQAMTFAPNDTLEITGSKVTIHGKPFIIAGTVKKGTQVLTLRDANGIPAWAGQGQRRQ